MAKTKTQYVCSECGALTAQWIGQCNQCQGWNTLSPHIAKKPVAERLAGYAGEVAGDVLTLSEVSTEKQPRCETKLTELDRVLGGGLVPGSVILIGGDPGVGKSTLILQALAAVQEDHPGLYVSGEESLQQIAMRAERLQCASANVRLLAETQVERILQHASQQKPKLLVIDSVQTLFTDLLSSAPGSVGQVRESTALLIRYAKQHDMSLILIGHVTKEGALAGPRVLEHMVDAVLYLEGERGARLRLLRAVKNRFGAVNELGVFAMTERGLRPVSNPSAIFLSRDAAALPGSVAMATWEGTRPLLVEVQALVDESALANPRRLAIGLEQNRLAMLLAVLHRHGGVASYNQDVFLNVVGGVRVLETAADLAITLAIVSSLNNRAIASDWLAFGEIGLAGEIRPVQSGQERLFEAQKQGFRVAIVPAGNAPKKPIEGLRVHAVKHVQEALTCLRDA